MNKNIINNFSPILALKTYFINKCLDAGVTSESHPSNIPHIRIGRNLTTSKPGFTDDKIVSWINIIMNSEAFVLVRMIEPQTKTRYMLYKISNFNQKSDIDQICKKLGIVNKDEVRYYNATIPYDVAYEGIPPITSVFTSNILLSTAWVDCMTPTKDNLEAIEMVRSAGLSFLSINPSDEKIFGHVLTNPGLLPKPQMLVYVVNNLLTGEEYIYKQFTDKTYTRLVKQKEKINEAESDEE